MSGDTRASARAFVRSLNILLKFARLYEFGHVRTAAQFETTWKELRRGVDESGGGGVLLGASGTQILLDGVPLGSAAGERSFAQLLITSGIASIHFAPTLTQPQLARFVRAFPSGNAKPTSLAEQLKSALAGETSIKVNEIRYVAEDSSVAGIKVAAQLTAKALGAHGDKFRDFFEDPNKMLQMILAAESSRASGGGGGGGAGGFSVAEEDVRAMLGLFAQLGKSRKDPEARMEVPTFQSRLSALPVRAQFTLQQALAGLAAQAPNEKADKPMLLKLAEHVAIRFALDSYERGELRVNAVKQLLDRMNAEIEGLRKILASQEDMMANAGLSVQSYTELLDQEFWAQVPDENKKEVLTSDESWCVPPRNVRAYLEDMLRRGELKTVNEILMKYAACISQENPEARRTTAIGLSDLAELYGSGDGSALMDAIRRLGNQLAIEREPELQTLVSAAFVRLSQEAASKRCYPAMQQALSSLETVEAQRPGSTQSLRPRIGAEERMPEFVEEALRSGQIADGMIDILALMPKATLHYVTHRFGHCGFRDDCELLSEVVRGLGDDATQRLIETLQTAPGSEGAETVGLLPLLAPEAVTKILPVRLSQWPRSSHDRTVRQLSSAPPERRAELLVALYDSLDVMIRPLAIDEMGMSGRPECIPKLLEF